LKELYIYNYLKTYKTIEKWYNEKELKVHYAAYLMFGKLSIAFIYPFIRIVDYFNINNRLAENSKSFFLIIAIIFFILDYFLIRKKFDRIVKYFDKKTEKEVASLRLYDYIIKFMIIIMNIILIFWI
jgi:hypothetical protein